MDDVGLQEAAGVFVASFVQDRDCRRPLAPPVSRFSAVSVELGNGESLRCNALPIAERSAPSCDGAWYMQTDVTKSMQALKRASFGSWLAHAWRNLEALESHVKRPAKHYGSSQVHHANGQ